MPKTTDNRHYTPAYAPSAWFSQRDSLTSTAIYSRNLDGSSRKLAYMNKRLPEAEKADHARLIAAGPTLLLALAQCLSALTQILDMLKHAEPISPRERYVLAGADAAEKAAMDALTRAVQSHE